MRAGRKFRKGRNQIVTKALPKFEIVLCHNPHLCFDKLGQAGKRTSLPTQKENLTLDAASQTTNDVLAQENVNQEGGCKDDHNGGEQAAPVAAVLHTIDHGEQTKGNGTQFLRVHEQQREEIFVPDVDEIED